MITLKQDDLQAMLIEAARIGGDIGARAVIDGMVTYNYGDAAKRLGISYPTLQRRMTEGKIRGIDGRITGAEIRRYLSQKSGNA